MLGVLVGAGIAQLALAAASPAIPKVLNWREDTERLSPLTRHVFWTYAAYIWVSHIAFGLLSVLAPHWLLDGTPLSRAVAGFIALWWGARLGLQFTMIGKHRPQGLKFVIAEFALVALFVACTATYGWIAVFGSAV